ncbi:predicted protein [Lichtheimia corymbifera JMRC:FSU:9682]|uniref:Uncharacterized protein n=1 Tax=Lichtheimia corymbifera JMRC:FSU:9682 TaxID=1263082 RepID=A0A068S9K9_9FUNG|nr:predicted protein [Lichtheimia corymbifera JMRC:FSU:9682]
MPRLNKGDRTESFVPATWRQRFSSLLPPLLLSHSRHPHQGGCRQGDIVALVLRVVMPPFLLGTHKGQLD